MPFNTVLKESLTRLRNHHRLLHSRGIQGEAGVLYDPDKGQFFKCPDGLKRFYASAVEPDEAQIKAEASRIKEAYDDVSGRKMNILNAFRVVTIQNLMRAITNYRASFFEEVNLNPDERPQYKHEYESEIDIFFTGPDGGVTRQRSIKAQKEVYPELYSRSTPKVGYPVIDQYQGDVSAAYQKTFNLAKDASEIDDQDHYDVLATCWGNFTTTGAKIDRTYIKGRRIRSGVLPTTNAIDVSGAGTGKTFKALRQVRLYCGRFGKLIDGTPLAPTGILLVPADQTDIFGEEVTPTGTTANPVADDVLRDYEHFNYQGVSWVIVPDLIIPQNYFIPVLNKKVGHSWAKSSLDRTFVFPSDPQQRLADNWEERQQQWWRGISVPGPWKAHTCRVKFA